MASSGKVTDCLLPPEDPDPQPDSCRLWIGNIDQKITEFALLKLLQKYGNLKKFDFLYHKSGPDQGKPRGYCFATYNNQENAEKARKSLNGKMALSKRLVVKAAHADKKDDIVSKPVNPFLKSSALGTSKDNSSTVAKIQAIEAKLQMMEQGKDAPMGSLHPSLAIANASSSSSSLSSWKPSSSQQDRHRHRPYSKNSAHR